MDSPGESRSEQGGDRRNALAARRQVLRGAAPIELARCFRDDPMLPRSSAIPLACDRLRHEDSAREAQSNDLERARLLAVRWCNRAMVNVTDEGVATAVESDELREVRPRVDPLGMAQVRARAEQSLFGSAAPAKLGRYVLLERSGHGGMGMCTRRTIRSCSARWRSRCCTHDSSTIARTSD